MRMQESSQKPSNDKQEFSRRQILKTLSAMGGTFVATSLMPGKWVSPVVDIGVLPVHAQTSVSDLQLVGPLEINLDTESGLNRLFKSREWPTPFTMPNVPTLTLPNPQPRAIRPLTVAPNATQTFQPP